MKATVCIFETNTSNFIQVPATQVYTALHWVIHHRDAFIHQ